MLCTLLSWKHDNEVFFSGQNKTDRKASLVNLSTSITGKMFCDISKEELAKLKPKRRTKGRKEVAASPEKGKQLQKKEEGC